MGFDICFYKFHPNGFEHGVKYLPKYGDVVTTPINDAHIDYEIWNKLHPFIDLEKDYTCHSSNGDILYFTNKNTNEEIKIFRADIPLEKPVITKMARVIEVGYFREGYGGDHTKLLGNHNMLELWTVFENNINIDEYSHQECLTKEEFLKLVSENSIMGRFKKVIKERSDVDIELLDYDVVYIGW